MFLLLFAPVFAADQGERPSEADAEGKGDAAKDEGKGGAVGGALAGWGAVPVATREQRADGTTHLWGQIQVWTTVLDQDVDVEADPATYGDPEADPGLSIHRARIGLDGFLPMGDKLGRNQVDYALALGIGAPYDVLSPVDTDVQLVDGFGRWALPTQVGTSSVAVGLQRVPFGRENGISSAFLPFQEGTVASNWMAPARGVGVVGGQSVRIGKGPDAPQVLARFGGFNPGEVFGADGTDLLLDGRLEVTAGDTYRTFSFDLENALGVGVAGYVHQQPGLRTQAAEADLLARYKWFTLLGEVLTSTITPVDTDVQPPGVFGETGRFGWNAQLSAFVPVRAKSGVEIAANASSFDDATQFDTVGDVLIVHGGATWRNLLPKTDLGLGYIHRAETFAEAPNDTLRLWFQVRPEATF
jgi:hypothetical protein